MPELREGHWIKERPELETYEDQSKYQLETVTELEPKLY